MQIHKNNLKMDYIDMNIRPDTIKLRKTQAEYSLL